MNIDLNGMVGVVTGAAGDIGRELCTALSEAGADVIATDIAGDPGDLQAAHFVRHDVTDPASWGSLAAFIDARHGRLDALVNNAGISIVARFEDMTLEEFRRLSAVNVDSIVIGTQALLPLLKAGGRARQGGAAIVNMSSAAGLKAAPFNSGYCATKAAVAMLTKVLGAEFGALGYNIRVNSVHPGPVDTRMMHALMARYVDISNAPDINAVRAAIIRTLPLRRFGQVRELGAAVAFLCSEAASYITCTELAVDGGFGGT